MTTSVANGDNIMVPPVSGGSVSDVAVANSIAAVANSNVAVANSIAAVANSNVAVANSNVAVANSIQQLQNSNNVMVAPVSGGSVNDVFSVSRRSVYVKVFGSIPITMKSELTTDEFAYLLVSKDAETKNKINGLRFAFGVKENIGSGRWFFMSPELSGFYAFKELKLLSYFEHELTNSWWFLDTSVEKIEGSVALKGSVAGGVRIGVNLFDEFISLYVKPNVGVGIIKFKEFGAHDDKEVKMQYKLMYGAGVGIDFNITKHLLVTAELNYDVLPYKITSKIKETLKTDCQMLSFNFGVGFKF